MKPSNPASFFVSGSNQREFRYDAGPHPYYVILRGSEYIPLSVMVFAASAEHALCIVGQMIDFEQACLVQRLRDEGYDNGAEQRQIDELRRALAGHGYEVCVGAADTSMLYKIGWASNDTL